jgi:hypothetical protein
METVIVRRFNDPYRSDEAIFARVIYFNCRWCGKPLTDDFTREHGWCDADCALNQYQAGIDELRAIAHMPARVEA